MHSTPQPAPDRADRILRQRHAEALAAVAKAVAASVTRGGKIRYASWTMGQAGLR